MEQWLEKRLTPYKQEQPRWRDLAVALQEYWDLYNTPHLERLENLRSVFTAHDEDIETLMREAGIQFEVALPVMQDNRSLAYAWRSYEVHRKDRKHVIEGILSRDYSNLFVRWMPLFAPKDLEYGHRFLSPMEFELYNYTMDDMYQTYRGILVTNLTHLYQHGSDKYDFGAAAQRKMDILRPAHITYEGALYFQVFKAEFPIIIENAATHELITMPLPWCNPRQFDRVPADERILDGGCFSYPHGTINTIRYVSEPMDIWPFDKPWSLDAGSYADGFYWSLYGHEKDKRRRFGGLGSRSDSFFINPDKIEAVLANKSAKERLSGNIFSLIRRFDDLPADLGALDLGGLGADIKSDKVSRLDAWPFDKAWSLDAGSHSPDGYLSLFGLESSKRGRHGCLASIRKTALGNRFKPAKAKAAQAKSRLTGKDFLPTRFDTERSDSACTDYKPLGVIGHARLAGSSFWDMDGWSLDLGLAGKEGLKLKRNGVLGKKKCLFGDNLQIQDHQNGTLSSSSDKMASIRGARNFEAPVAASVKSTRRKSGAAKVGARPLPACPSLDDVPADFAPLDINYQPESYLS